MATRPNIVFQPCQTGPTHTNTNIANQAACFRTPKPQPFNVGTAAPATPTAQQLWPIKQ